MFQCQSRALFQAVVSAVLDLLQGQKAGDMESQGAGLAKRLATLLSGLMECMCFAGIIFGWASLVYVLKGLHYFEDLCKPVANMTVNATHETGMAELPAHVWQRE